MTLVQKSPELFLAEGSICEVGESEIKTLKRSEERRVGKEC